MPAGQSLEPDALLLLGETYLKMHKWADARQSFLNLLQKFPASALSSAAKGYLAYLHDSGVGFALRARRAPAGGGAHTRARFAG